MEGLARPAPPDTALRYGFGRFSFHSTNRRRLIGLWPTIPPPLRLAALGTSPPYSWGRGRAPSLRPCFPRPSRSGGEVPSAARRRGGIGEVSRYLPDLYRK